MVENRWPNERFRCGLFSWSLASFGASRHWHTRFHEAQDLSSFRTMMFLSFFTFPFVFFSSNRCRFAKMNVNCPFTVSLPVQFTHRSFPIQSPAAVCLLFTPLISSGFKKATFKKKKKSSLPKPHLHPQKALLHSEPSWSCWKADSKKPKNEKDPRAEFSFRASH